MLLLRSSVTDVPRLTDSLVGRHRDHPGNARPRATRVMLGDHCHVEVE
ncbi:MAG: hypothetical protein R2695_03295 [Acidimicrobiales bacterium]